MQIETKTNQAKDCFIIGSGSSLLNLTVEEKEYLNNHPHTLAMNRYLLFFEKIGVVPKDLFLGDYHSILSHRVLLKTIKKINKLSIFPNYYVDEYYQNLKKPLFKDFF